MDELGEALSELQRDSVAAFFAGCAERLLPLYEHFSTKEHWGSPELLRQALDDVWRYLEGGPPPPARQRLDEIAGLTPHGADFDAPDSTFAQDAAICVDAAIRAASRTEKVDERWVEYAVEATKVAACMEDTGFMDLGSEDATAWQHQALDNPKLRSDIEFYRHTLASLKGAEPLDANSVQDLRRRMRDSRWTHETLMTKSR